MNLTVAIPTNADWQRLEYLENSICNTFDQEHVKFVFIDNCNTFGHDMKPWIEKVQKQYRGKIELLVLKERVGLTTAWKAATDHSDTDWTILANDDIYFNPSWDLNFKRLATHEAPGFGIYLLCHPYNWSGFAVNKDFVERFPWRTEFPAGYHEDNDLYLRVASAYCYTAKSDIYSKAIYCLPYVTNGREYCFTHSTDNADSKRSTHYTRWDQKANQLIFHKYWRQCHPTTPGAIENKNGNYFVRV